MLGMPLPGWPEGSRREEQRDVTSFPKMTNCHVGDAAARLSDQLMKGVFSLTAVVRSDIRGAKMVQMGRFATEPL